MWGCPLDADEKGCISSDFWDVSLESFLSNFRRVSLEMFLCLTPSSLFFMEVNSNDFASRTTTWVFRARSGINSSLLMQEKTWRILINPVCFSAWFFLILYPLISLLFSLTSCFSYCFLFVLLNRLIKVCTPRLQDCDCNSRTEGKAQLRG